MLNIDNAHDGSGDGVNSLEAILRRQPKEVQDNPFVERAAEKLRVIHIDERLHQIKHLNAGTIGKPYLHATSGAESAVFSYDSIVDSIDGVFPSKIGSLYLHFPFCTKKCRFCHYYKNPSATPLEWERFPRYIAEELRLLQSLFQFDKIRSETIHYGGGTPSLLSANAWRRFVDDVGRYTDRDSALEVALEVDPEDVDAEKLRAWMETGVDRISLGIQSFDPGVLAYLRRAHTADQAFAAMALLSESGPPNINVDLMYGMPNRPLSSWISDLEALRHYPPHSVTCYATRPDPRNVLERAHDFPSELERILAHQIAIEYMTELGYFQYSPNQFITNYQGACLAKNNRNRCLDVVGVGPRAHSIFQGWFYENFVGEAGYIETISRETLCPLKGSALEISQEKRRFVQFGLKLSGLGKPDHDNGVILGDYQHRFGRQMHDDFGGCLNRLNELGLIEKHGDDRISLTHAGIILVYEVTKYLENAQLEH